MDRRDTEGPPRFDSTRKPQHILSRRSKIGCRVYFFSGPEARMPRESAEPGIVSIVRGEACRGPDFPSFTHGHCCNDVRPRLGNCYLRYERSPHNVLLCSVLSARRAVRVRSTRLLHLSGPNRDDDCDFEIGNRKSEMRPRWNRNPGYGIYLRCTESIDPAAS